MEALAGISRQILDCIHKALPTGNADKGKMAKTIT